MNCEWPDLLLKVSASSLEGRGSSGSDPDFFLVHFPANIPYTPSMTTTKPIVNLALDASLLSRIDDFWHDQRFNARSEAMRWLLEAALDRKLSPKKATKKGAN